MGDTLYLHIGLPKSGTTFLQAVLHANWQRLLERDGLLWPGPRWSEHVRAASDLLGKTPAGVEDPSGAWERALQAIRLAPGRGGVISMEWLCQAEAEHLDRLASTLGEMDLQVVVTVRALAHTLPSAWQEFCQNWETPTLREFLQSITSDSAMDSHISRIFWTEQDLGKILPRWVDAFGSERVKVVTVPSGGGSTLWQRFATALQIRDEAVYDTNLRGANSSLGLASAELMRRINQVSHRDNLPAEIYHRSFKNRLAKEILVERRPRESAVRLPREFVDFVVERSSRQVDHVCAAGVEVIGDLGELTAMPDATDELPENQPAGALLEAALDGIVGFGRSLARDNERCVRDLAAASERARELEAELAATREQLADWERRGQRWRDAPLRQAAINLSEARPTVMRARVAYWNVVNAGRRLGGLSTPEAPDTDDAR